MTEIYPVRFVFDCLFLPRRGGLAERMFRRLGGKPR